VAIRTVRSPAVPPSEAGNAQFRAAQLQSLAQATHTGFGYWIAVALLTVLTVGNLVAIILLTRRRPSPVAGDPDGGQPELVPQTG